MDTEELLARIRDSDPDALAEFIDRQRPELLSFVTSIMGSHLRGVVEPDDLVQELATSALAALPRIPKEDLDVGRWLEQLARRRVVDAHRHHFGAAKRSASRQRTIHAVDDDQAGDLEKLLIASITSPSAAVSRNMKMARVQNAMLQLTDEQRGTLHLRFGEGLPTKEIAEMLGKSDGAIRVLLTRTIQRLQQLLSSREE